MQNLIVSLGVVRIPSVFLSKLVTLGLVLAVFSAHADKIGPACEMQMSHGPEAIFASSLADLKEQLGHLRGSSKDFLDHYKKARNAAFQLEMMAKFMRNQQGNMTRFAKIRSITKELEDKLGRFNETDELLSKFEKADITLPNGESAKEHYEAKLDKEISAVRQWLTSSGWFRVTGRTREIETLIEDMKWLEQKEFREFAIQAITEELREFQDEVDSGEYDPANKKGYTMEEVEVKVHKLRRAIRMYSQIMAYTGGLFKLTESKRGLRRKSLAAVQHFSPILKNRIAATEYAKLPDPYDENPILVPRALFVVITSHVEVLGNAKDWAQNIERLLHEGFQGRADLDHLDISLVNRDGIPVPFNALAASILKEIKETQFFANLARAIRDLNE
jgi:hypothetical protein